MAFNFLVPSYCRSSNVNTREPKEPIYPQKDSSDPVYTVSEEKLRGAIHIPKNYTFGAKLPVIFCPGTATPSGISYRFNLYRLLVENDLADPVFLNVPGTTAGDLQVTAEYYAYAIHYISGTQSHRGDGRVVIIAQSQGCQNTQWTLKYWPSTRSVVSQFIAISAGFKGTKVPSRHPFLLSYVFPVPAIHQQMDTSKFIAALLSDDGDSAYVPTMSIYTNEDEVIDPHRGPSASAYLKDVRGVGVTNVEIQDHCPRDTKAGAKITHVAVIYHSLTWAMIVDALTHGDSGDPKRLDIDAVCKSEHAPGVGLLDIIRTRIGDYVSLVYLLKFMPKYHTEPELVPYVRSRL